MRASGSTGPARVASISGTLVGMRRASLRSLTPADCRGVYITTTLALAVLAACSTGARANSHYRYPREVTYGRTSTCPDVRLPPLRDGNVSPDAARCSYSDANGAKVTHLAGKVLAEGGPGDPGVGVADVKVAVHAVEGPLFDPASPGKRLGHATTDAQGNYSVRGIFIPGDYALVVNEPTGEPLTFRVVRVEPDATGELRDLHVVIPIDPRLKAEAAEPPPPLPDARLHPHVPTPVAGAAAPPGTPATLPTAKSNATSLKPPPAGLRMRPPAGPSTPTSDATPAR